VKHADGDLPGHWANARVDAYLRVDAKEAFGDNISAESVF